MEIVVLPAGKSLDVCAEMREKKKLRGVDTEHQRKRRRKKEKVAELKAAEENKMDMFDFLNTKIFKKSKTYNVACPPFLLPLYVATLLKFISIISIPSYRSH